MHRSPAKLLRRIARPECDFFINYRGIDTKRTVVGLLYDQLTKLKVRSLLDTMKPGDKLFDHIDKAILGCKVGVAIFSPTYCESCFCLHELALLVESKKRIIPIFYDVKQTSELQVRIDDGSCPAKELRRFSSALEEAKCIVGLSYDPSKGRISLILRVIFWVNISVIVECGVVLTFSIMSFRDWLELVRNATDAVIMNLLEVDEERKNKE